MFITKKHLPRRTFLRGVGATLALPLLDAMVPARAASNRERPLAPGVRLPAARRDHGQVDAGHRRRGFEFSPILKPLEPFRNHLTSSAGSATARPTATAVHSLSPTTWLSGVRPKPTQGVDAYAGITADQIAAQRIGQDTLLPSMELATEDQSGLIGACDRDYGCIYMNTLSWRTPTTPMPMEINPRKVFERMFGQGGTRGRSPGAHRGGPQHARRDHEADRRPAAQARRAGPRDGQRLSGERARDRAAHPDRGDSSSRLDLDAARRRRSAFRSSSKSTSG